jgi:glycine C-acetyltransferase
MSDARLTQRYADELDQIRAQGLFKSERIIASPQSAEIALADGRKVLNFCANNYLGLADHPDIIAAAKDALDSHGFGMASVRFICGTQDLHKRLEKTIAAFFGTEDTILYAACFDANGGLFEPLLDEQRRHRQRRAESRLDHRRRAPVQRRSVIATPTATWPIWSDSCSRRKPTARAPS